MSALAGKKRTPFGELTRNARARLRALRARCKRTPDREFEMAANRTIFCSVVLVYLIAAYVLGFDLDGRTLGDALPGILLCFVYCFGILLHLLWTMRPSPVRRIVAIFGDMTTVGAALIVGGEPLAIMYPLYLWTIFGNGFRFGLLYLRVATAAAAASFLIVVTNTTYWLGHWGLSVGLLLAIVMLPLYASSLIQKLSQAREVAEEASKAKTMFLASVSHELRTPLNAIIGMSGLLKSSRLNADQRDMSQTIHASARALLRLINSVLDYSRLEAGQMPSQTSDFDLHALLIDIRGMTAAQCLDKPVRVTLAVDPMIQSQIVADRRAIEEALINLAGNAVKFTTSGFVLIGAELVEQNEERMKIRFRVEDSGIGIANEAQDRIFDRFTQADDSILNRFGGTGLGLAIAKQLVEGAGGTIGLDSTPSIGSTFWFELSVQGGTASPAPLNLQDAVEVVIFSGDMEDVSKLTTSLGEQGVTWCQTADAEAFRTKVRKVVDSKNRRCLGICTSSTRTLGEQSLSMVIEDRDWSRVFSFLEYATAYQHDNPLAARRGEVSLARLYGDFESGELERILRLSAAADTVSAASDHVVAQPLRSLSILVADDNRTNQKVIRKILEQHGHEVVTVGNGEQALDRLAEGGIDLVFMDVNMPDLNGIEATKIYRFSTITQEPAKAVRIIGLTADVTPERERLCRQAGMNDVLNKPIEPQALLEYVARIAGIQDAEADAEEVKNSSEPVAGETASIPEACIDEKMVEELERLGGKDFVADLVSGFLHDAAQTLAQLHQSAEGRDAQAFRDQAHALRSGAANIGAQRIYSLCLSWRNVDERELIEQGQNNLKKLEREFELVKAALSENLTGQATHRTLN